MFQPNPGANWKNDMNTSFPMKTTIKKSILLPTLIAGLSLVPAGRVTAQTFTTLYSFWRLSRMGRFSVGGVILSGNTLYGIATYGGNSHQGTVFKVKRGRTDFY
jgi:hypothetical protein